MNFTISDKFCEFFVNFMIFWEIRKNHLVLILDKFSADPDASKLMQMRQDSRSWSFLRRHLIISRADPDRDDKHWCSQWTSHYRCITWPWLFVQRNHRNYRVPGHGASSSATQIPGRGAASGAIYSSVCSEALVEFELQPPRVLLNDVRSIGAATGTSPLAAMSDFSSPPLRFLARSPILCILIVTSSSVGDLYWFRPLPPIPVY